jgi:capsular polysaccharide export protein
MTNLFDIITSSHRRVLLLQGPIGPFFHNLSDDLVKAGASVLKINFNGGDWLYYPSKSVNYRGSLDEWQSYLERFISKNQIDLILLFGDCRPIHIAARAVAEKLGVELGVFEEGYVRPDYITLESFGVNAHSLLSKDPNHYLESIPVALPAASPVGKPFFYAMVWAILYNISAILLSPFFSGYHHHRKLSMSESIRWIRSFWRKLIFLMKEKGIASRLSGELSKKYYLVPLQVGGDAQIQNHSSFKSIREFIEEVMLSFAQNAPKDTFLVIKQHPMERGHSMYTPLIDDLSKELRVSRRVLYIHDQHLPTLLGHARGVIVVNSTVGFSAINHKTPVKALGSAIYDMTGLTHQGELEDFWLNAKEPSPLLYEAFLREVIRKTQINGNFYRRLPVKSYKSGVVWQ